MRLPAQLTVLTQGTFPHVHLLSEAYSRKTRLDLEMPGKSEWRAIEQVKPAIEAGSISESTIDERARAALQLLKQTGKFDDRRVDIPETAQDLPEHRALIRQAGAEGIVLLKNEGVLPLKKEKLKKVALLGPLAKYAAAHGGGSASLNCHYKVSPFDAFTTRLGAYVDVTYSKGTSTRKKLSRSTSQRKCDRKVQLLTGLQEHIYSECILTWKRVAKTQAEAPGLLPNIGKTRRSRASRCTPTNFLAALSQL